MGLQGLSGALARIVCSLAGHRFVVWARSHQAPPRHPHLGAWARCERCGHERDWLGEGVSRDARLLDLVHGVARPLHEIVAIARGARPPERAEAPAAVVSAPPQPARRSGRRGNGEGRGSTRRDARPRAPRERDPQDR